MWAFLNSQVAAWCFGGLVVAALGYAYFDNHHGSSGSHHHPQTCSAKY